MEKEYTKGISLEVNFQTYIGGNITSIACDMQEV